MSFRPLEEDEFSLSAEEARSLPEAELRERFHEIVVELVGCFGSAELPAIFARHVSTLTHDEILMAIETHNYWFDPPELRRGEPVA